MKTDEKMILKNIFVVLFYVCFKIWGGGDKNLEWYKWEGYIEMK